MRSCFHVEALSHEQCTLLGHRANLETTYEGSLSKVMCPNKESYYANIPFRLFAKTPCICVMERVVEMAPTWSQSYCMRPCRA